MSKTLADGDAQKTLAQIHEEFTECTLCTEVYITPKMLPCMHTFCISCLERYGRGKTTGSKLPCPLCREDFTIPSGGFAAFPNNFYIGRLVELRQKSTETKEDKLCMICADRQSQGAMQIPLAEKYCVTCQKSLCVQCAKEHKSNSSSSSHTMEQLNGDVKSGAGLVLSTDPVTCISHPKDIVSVYCKTCSMLVCVKCFFKQHNKHDCADVEDMATECYKEINKELETLVPNSSQFRQLSSQQEAEIDTMLKNAESVKSAIIVQTDVLKKFVDDCKSKVIAELDSFTNSSLIQMRNSKMVTDASAAAIDDLVHLAEHVKENGSQIDVIKFASQLKAKKRELKAIPDKNTLCHSELSFTAADIKTFTANGADSLIGKLNAKVSSAGAGE